VIFVTAGTAPELQHQAPTKSLVLIVRVHSGRGGENFPVRKWPSATPHDQCALPLTLRLYPGVPLSGERSASSLYPWVLIGIAPRYRSFKPAGEGERLANE
jgi:hypothetical protein